MVPNTQVLNKLFGIKDAGKKAWKTKKIPLRDFERITGELTASVSTFAAYLDMLTVELSLVDPIRGIEVHERVNHPRLEAG